MSDSEGTPNFDKPTDAASGQPTDPAAGQPGGQPGREPGATPPPYGQAPYGQAPYGQAPYGQPGGQPGYGAAPYQQPGPVALTPDQERMWGGAAHWSALVGSVIGGFAFLGPLIVMLTKGNESAYVRRQAVESLNFQLSILIYAVVSIALMLVLIGFLTIIAVGICWLVFTIMGSIKASNGEEYRYPLTIRMVS